MSGTGYTPNDRPAPAGQAAHLAAHFGRLPPHPEGNNPQGWPNIRKLARQFD